VRDVSTGRDPRHRSWCDARDWTAEPQHLSFETTFIRGAK
jgi:hypothetical protein